MANKPHKARNDNKIREPAPPALQAGRARAKLFRNGSSQAVRLPKAFRLPGREVWVRREGRCVVLEPVEDVPRDANGWPQGLWEELDRLRAGLDPNEFAAPEDPVPEPVPPLDDA